MNSDPEQIITVFGIHMNVCFIQLLKQVIGNISEIHFTLQNYDLLVFVGNIQNNGSKKANFIIYQILGSSKRHFLYFFTFLMTQPWRCPSRVCCGYF